MSGIIYATANHPATDAGDARAITSAPLGITLEVVQLAVYGSGNTATTTPQYFLIASESSATGGTYDLSVVGTAFKIGICPVTVTTGTLPIASGGAVVLPINAKGNAGPRVLIPPGMILAWGPDASTDGGMTHTCITREVNPGE